MESHTYTIDLDWVADRKGIMCSPELLEHSVGNSSCLEVATPPEFPHGIPGIWSPEHLYTAAVNSCFMTTFLAVAENSQLEFSAFSCSAKGVLAKVDGKYEMTKVHLAPIITIPYEKDRERTERIAHKAEAACLISRSIKSVVSLHPTIHVQ